MVCASLNHGEFELWEMYEGLLMCQGGLVGTGKWEQSCEQTAKQVVIKSVICHLRILCASVGRRSDVRDASFFLRNYRVTEF